MLEHLKRAAIVAGVIVGLSAVAFFAMLFGTDEYR